MAKNKRFDEILKLLNENEYLTVAYLCEKLHYSPATIRRDITAMQQNGIIKKSYGKISFVNDNKRYIPPYELCQQSFAQKKMQIASVAAKMIKNNQVIYLNGGTTSAYIANFLVPSHEITVITNNIELALNLKNRNIHVFCTGGELTTLTSSLYGKITRDMLLQINIDIMFFSSTSLSESGIISEPNCDIVLTIQTAMRQSEKVVYLVNDDKIGSSSMFNVCNIEEVNTVISNCDISKRFSCKTDKIDFVY